MRDNFELAVDQIIDISSNSLGELELLSYSEEENSLKIEISLLCNFTKNNPNGIKFNERERFTILFNNNYPFDIPIIIVPHLKFMGRPHVLWGRILCLYQSPNTEWNPERGIFGFLDRLLDWLEKASDNDLDPIDIPLHPPYAQIDYKMPTIIISENSPQFSADSWFGYAILDKITNSCFYIKEWKHISSDIKKAFIAPVMLLSKDMPFEYPDNFGALNYVLKQKGIEISQYYELLAKASKINTEKNGLFIIIGTPMKGLRINKRQHISIWYLKEDITSKIRTVFTSNPIKEIEKIKKKNDEFIDWAKKSKLSWCPVYDIREETTLSRDINSNFCWFKNKSIALFGCGALGSIISEQLIRTGVRKIILYDKAKVNPGILVRQNFYEEDIGKPKCFVLKERLSKIYVKLKQVIIEAKYVDIINIINENNFQEDIDLLIDCTASISVLKKIDNFFVNNHKKIPIVSICIGHNSNNGFVVLSNKNSDGGPDKLIRKVKITLCKKDYKYYLNEFFPDKPRTDIFQPEPGCSENTFTGSIADINMLSSSMMNIIGKDLQRLESNSSSAHFIRHLDYIDIDNTPFIISFIYPQEENIYFDILMGYKIIISKYAHEKIINDIEISKKETKPISETGGLLLGDFDDLNKIVYIDLATSAPTDSIKSPTEFICGINGTKELCENEKKKSGGAINFIGIWHSHPYSKSDFSNKDKNSMLVIVKELSPPKDLMLIIGFDDVNYDFKAFLFHKNKFATK